MTHWLDPLRDKLESLPAPAVFFFRDDDAGWEDKALLRLLDVFAQESAPIDLAVIPVALDEPLATTLRDRREKSGCRLHFHQHGFSHINHETQGRKSEFGNSRGLVEQRLDIAAGRARLAQFFGHDPQPIFTPPWNRCTRDTITALHNLGFAALSRDATTCALPRDGLAEIPIVVDWAKREHPQASGLTALGARLADAAVHQDLVGIMLHHAWLVDEDLQVLRELIHLFSGHSNARLVNMAQAIGFAKKITP